jgi:hypothetical protein
MSWLAAQTMHSPGWEPVPFGESRGARGLFALQRRLVALTLLLLPFNWLLGTALLWAYAVAAILALSWERLSLLEGAYGFLAAVLVFALVIAMANEAAFRPTAFSPRSTTSPSSAGWSPSRISGARRSCDPQTMRR